MQNPGPSYILRVLCTLGISLAIADSQKPSLPEGKFFGSLFSEGGLFGGLHPLRKPSSVTDDLIEPVDQSTLELVIVVTRHGSRSPTGTYPNDPYPYFNSNHWPEGRGGLTSYGKRQMYRLGRNLRRRYSKYLSAEYRGSEVKVMSNPVERIYMSAQCLTTGLFPPVGHQIWNTKIEWQPIPVYEDSFDVTKVVSSSTLCPRAIEEENEALKKIENDFGSKFFDVYETLSAYSGQDVGSIGDTLGFYDIFQLQYENGFVLPRWTREIFPEPLTTISAIGNQALTAGTPQLIRLTAGPVLKSISNRMKMKIDGASGQAQRKLFINAAHDNTLIALLTGLGVVEPIYPGTSSHLIFELHKTNSDDRVVRAFYFNSSDVRKPTNIRMAACSSLPCRLEDFDQLANGINPDDWDEECKN